MTFRFDCVISVRFRVTQCFVAENMKCVFGFSLIFLIFLRNTQQQCFSDKDDNGFIDPTSRTGLYTGQQDFSLALLQSINRLMPNENLFFSPYSTYHALLIAYFLAGGQTETYLKKVLRLEPKV